MRIHHIAISVKDQEKSVKFYIGRALVKRKKFEEVRPQTSREV